MNIITRHAWLVFPALVAATIVADSTPRSKASKQEKIVYLVCSELDGKTRGGNGSGTDGSVTFVTRRVGEADAVFLGEHVLTDRVYGAARSARSAQGQAKACPAGR